MTIVALVKSREGFDCYADSLISIHGATRLNVYCKVLILPVTYRVTRDGRTTTKSQKIGMAIAGNLAAATAVYTILSGALQSLHSHDARKPPTSAGIADLALRLSRIVYDDVRALGENGKFGFFLFGHEVSDGSPFSYCFSIGLSVDGVYEVQFKDLALMQAGRVETLGSGGEKFKEILVASNGSGVPLNELFFQFVRSGKVETVGGYPQVLLARPDAVTIEPVLIGSDDGESASMYHSGFNVDGYRTVGDYMIGLTLPSFNMERVHLNQNLREEGYDPNTDNLSDDKVNQVMFQWLLKVHSRSGTKIDRQGVINVGHPKLLRPEKYLVYECTSCGADNRVFHSVHRLKSKPFSDDLNFQISCNSCTSSFRVRANSFALKPVEN